LLTERESCREPLIADLRSCPKCATRSPGYERPRRSPLAMIILVLGACALFSGAQNFLVPIVAGGFVLGGLAILLG
jgi:hypothetical protein